MDGLVTLSSTRSSFSISTVSSCSLQANAPLGITEHNEGPPAHAFEQADAQHSLTDHLDPTMKVFSQRDPGNTGCVECTVLLDELVAVIDHFPQPKVQKAVLYHFKHHHPLVPMRDSFRQVALILIKAIERRIQDAAHSLEIEDAVDIGEFFDFDKYYLFEDTATHPQCSILDPSKATHARVSTPMYLKNQEEEEGEASSDSFVQDVVQKERIVKWLANVEVGDWNEEKT
jgi:hypothetical protein